MTMNLNNPFNQEEFGEWISEFLPGFEIDIRKVDVPTKFKDVISIKTIGESSIGVRVYIVEMENDPSKRKVGLTTESFSLLKDYGVPNALIAYFSKSSSQWRFSLLTSTPVWDEGKVITKLSNPKRQSYILGQNTKINTPTKFLIKKGEIIDFNDLKDRFSLEVVNKDFYNEIAENFTKLVGGTRGEGSKKKTFNPQLKLPSTDESSPLLQEFAVRLIGRIIFCWFLREKISPNGIPLMPKNLLSLDAISNNTNYYHSILEPIFFEVLNKRTIERDDPYSHDPYALIPYLNGGLFSPQEDDFYKRRRGEQSQFLNTLIIPDEWVKEFFNVLESYNFTIDENTSYDEDLSIDPEMLGRIFENLLAEINPETGESARKSTGSYYTPRPIVDYMVDESLIQYLQKRTGIDEKKLRAVISYDLADDALYPLEENEKHNIIDALEKVKILDPACGSGAFPIGALQKIVFILQQVDFDGQIWFKKQLLRTSPELRRVMEREFAHKNFDYIRKLGIIRENIYGIDIQSIATEISRLRCFLTLIVDQRVHDDIENRGIEPLPNLDFKFVTANSLFGLPEIDSTQQTMFDNYDKIYELKDVRDQYFNASGIEREQLKNEFTLKQKRLFIDLQKEYGWAGIAKAELTTKLSDWDPFVHKSTSWFDPEWMFGIKDGFDIVIGNPPYGLINKKQNKHISITMDEKEFEELKKKYPDATGGMINIFRFFIVQSINLLKPEGCFCEIFPLSFTGDQSMSRLRKSVLSNTKIISIEAFPERDDVNKRVFQPVKMSVCIMTLINTKNETPFTLRINHDRFVDFSNEKVLLSIQDLKLFDPENISIPLLNTRDINLLKKIYTTSMRFGNFSRCYDGEVHLTKYKRFITDDPNDATLIKGAIVDRYQIREKMSQGEIQYLNKAGFLANNSGSKAQHYKNPRIVMQRITGVNEKIRIKATIIGENIFCANSIGYLVLEEKSYDLNCVLAVLNSKVSNYIFKLFSTNSNVNGYEIENLPFPRFNVDDRNKLNEYVESILDLNQSNTSHDLEAQKLIENKINKIIFNVYKLSEEEIEIIEGSINSIPLTFEEPLEEEMSVYSTPE